MRPYQDGFYDLYALRRDREGRLSQAEKIAYILTQLSLCHFPLPSATCLDLGCSSGTITAALAPLFSKTVGLDYDETALKNAERVGSSKPAFLRGDAMRLPVPDSSIDVVICAQVYEHVPDDTRLVAEIYRVLKPGGMVFFSGPNKLFPLEPHYRLPFLHWLPGKLANGYLRLLGRGNQYYERSRTLWSLRRLVAPFVVQDVTIEVLIRKAQRTPSGVRATLLSRVPSFAWNLLLPALPNYNWILYKPSKQNGLARS